MSLRERIEEALIAGGFKPANIADLEKAEALAKTLESDALRSYLSIHRRTLERKETPTPHAGPSLDEALHAADTTPAPAEPAQAPTPRTERPTDHEKTYWIGIRHIRALAEDPALAEQLFDVKRISPRISVISRDNADGRIRGRRDAPKRATGQSGYDYQMTGASFAELCVKPEYHGTFPIDALERVLAGETTNSTEHRASDTTPATPVAPPAPEIRATTPTAPAPQTAPHPHTYLITRKAVEALHEDESISPLIKVVSGIMKRLGESHRDNDGRILDRTEDERGTVTYRVNGNAAIEFLVRTEQRDAFDLASIAHLAHTNGQPTRATPSATPKTASPVPATTAETQSATESAGIYVGKRHLLALKDDAGRTLYTKEQAQEAVTELGKAYRKNRDRRVTERKEAPRPQLSAQPCYDYHVDEKTFLALTATPAHFNWAKLEELITGKTPTTNTAPNASAQMTQVNIQIRATPTEAPAAPSAPAPTAAAPTYETRKYSPVDRDKIKTGSKWYLINERSTEGLEGTLDQANITYNVEAAHRQNAILQNRINPATQQAEYLVSEETLRGLCYKDPEHESTTFNRDALLSKLEPSRAKYAVVVTDLDGFPGAAPLGVIKGRFKNDILAVPNVTSGNGFILFLSAEQIEKICCGRHENEPKAFSEHWQKITGDTLPSYRQQPSPAT